MQRQRGREAATRTGTPDRDAALVHRRQIRQPGQRRIAVLDRNGVGVFGRQPVVDRRDGDPETTGEPKAQNVVLTRMADDVATAVDPQQRRSRTRQFGRPVQPHADARRQRQRLDVLGHVPPHPSRGHSKDGQRHGRHRLLRDEARDAAQIGMEVGGLRHLTSMDYVSWVSKAIRSPR